MHFTVCILILQVCREFHRGIGKFHIRAGHRLNGHGAFSVAHAQAQFQFLGPAGNLIGHLTVFHGSSLAFFPVGEHGLRGIRKQGLEGVRQVGLHIQFGSQKIIRMGGRGARGFPLPFQHLPKRLLTCRIRKCVFGLHGKLFTARYIKHPPYICSAIYAQSAFLDKGVTFFTGHGPTLERIPAGIWGVVDCEK